MLDASIEITDAWILELRPAKNSVQQNRPYAFLIEQEPTPQGTVEPVATIFLTNRECPFRCLMCDLWKNTTDEIVERGMITEQIRWALDHLPPARHVKLYNSGNFFDPGAIPEIEYQAIANIVSRFDTVVVETHPLMVGRRCFEFNELLDAHLHVAMGLETVHPDVLPRLNKRMTLIDFERAAAELVKQGMSVRTFILLRPPFLTDEEGVIWAKKSIDFAFDSGVECCAVIPTRAGNGAMEHLASEGHFEPPTLESLEEVIDYALGLNRGRVFADLWDIEKTAHLFPNGARRIKRLARQNLTQVVEPKVCCDSADSIQESTK